MSFYIIVTHPADHPVSGVFWVKRRMFIQADVKTKLRQLVQQQTAQQHYFLMLIVFIVLSVDD